MKLYSLKTTIDLPISIEEAWRYFSDPKNLSKITPPDLQMKITSEVVDNIYAGMIITYTVKPILGIPVNWVTEITQVNQPYLFIDEQRLGPYRFWHHQHHFQAIEGGTRIQDQVHYALPFGLLGSIMNRFKVSYQLQQIFAHRRQILENTFGKLET